MGKHIFIVNGKPRAGKDTFADILNEFIGVYKVSSIDRIKDIATMCGWRGGKTEKDRKFLSDLKLLTSEYSDFAFNDLKTHVRLFNKDHKSRTEVMLIDIREPEEIERAKQEFGAKTIYIRNDNVPAITSNMADANVENYKYDFIIDNSGTLADLTYEVMQFYVGVLGGVYIEEPNEVVNARGLATVGNKNS